MQSNPKIALKIFGTALFSCFLCLFVQLSFFTMIKSFSTEVVEYEVYMVNDDSTSKYIGNIPKSEKPAEPEKNMRYMAKYSEIPASAKIVEIVLDMVCGLGILFCTTGSILANVAAKDRNDCDFNNIPYNKNRGLYLGLLSAIPAIVVYLAVLIMKFLPENKAFDWTFWVLRIIILCPVKPLIDLMTGTAAILADAPVWSIAAIGVFPLLWILACFILYRLCYNADSVLAKLLYKSTNKKNNARRLGGM